MPYNRILSCSFAGFLSRTCFTRALTWLHLKRILEIGRDIGTNLSSWNAECLAGVTRLTWRASRCAPLVVAPVRLGTSGREHLNNSAVYRRTYNDARAHTPRLWPLLTATWRSLGNASKERETEKDISFSCPFSCTVKVDVLFFNAPRCADSRGVLYGDRLRAANGTETRSNATARWTVRIEIWSRGEWCYGSILYKWYVSVILFGRLEKDRSREFIIPRWCFRAKIFNIGIFHTTSFAKAKIRAVAKSSSLTISGICRRYSVSARAPYYAHVFTQHYEKLWKFISPQLK